MVGINKALTELTRKGGAPIGTGPGSGYNIDMDDAMTQTGDNEEGFPTTRDDAVKQQRQGTRRFFTNGHLHIGESDEEDEGLKTELEESSKNNVKKMLEDIISKKDIDSTIVNRLRDNEFRRNGIPPLEAMKDSNPIVVRKVNLLKDILTRNTVSGEEKGIIINSLLDMDMYDIPSEYKEELKKKL